MSRALIVVDVQNDFCEGGSLAVEGGEHVAEQITQWVAAFGDPLAPVCEYDLIVATQDWHPTGPFDHFSETPNYDTTWPPHCVQSTTGAALHNGLRLPQHTRVVRKGQESAAYSGFEGKDVLSGNTLGQLLKYYLITHVDVVGLATDYCVKATALDAARLGYATSVLLPLTAGVAPESTRQALMDLGAAGVALEGDYV